MDLALHVSDFTPFGDPAGIAPGLAATARAAEEGGFSTLTLMDHWFQMEAVAPASDPMLDGYTTLGFLAGQTERLQLGLLVTGVTYRHPGLLAKTLATLDVLSGGRALLGIGAAWYEREHAGLGVPFPPVAERFERLEETLRICRQMWSEDDRPFHGEHYRLAETLCVPQPLQPGGPPVLIGGMGERKTLRLVARYADACNLFDAGPEVVAHKLTVLDRHCADAGRDPAEVRRTVVTGTDPLADVDAFVASMRTYAALGVDTVWVGSATDDLPGWVTRVGELVAPRLREL
ncbi:LLM class F420-dependent oxidoreductase [Auraticoccus monumenti]|uniref:Probable F420-dependent oxidoreductase, Rv1855c family n=1 Tax=Auraticoccus monumenti TaxID=675864 RepID=A0A1G6YWU2_9ACTN|nr:LLM class F420-dependent oxidoreductase [Auraticoccus monumenti]SDD94974.1 probable F420-dependent oxidoreductase, Rv1855c family [Auraticoccus monumenti]